MLFNNAKEWDIQDKIHIGLYVNSSEWALLFYWEWMIDSFSLHFLCFNLHVGWGEEFFI